jgi:hypothetical protein
VSPKASFSALTHRLRTDESGLSALEKLGVAAIIISVLAFIPPVRGALGDFYDAIFKQIDPDTGEVTAFSIATRGILVTLVSVVSFIGTGYLLLYTNLGTKLAFLVTGAATFGWMVVGGALFIAYAPRGLRPRSVEGLNALQIRIPAIAMTLGSFILFLMFLVALDRYEKLDSEVATTE